MITIHRNADERCYILTCSVVLACSRTDVFAFFSDAFQLEQITPNWLVVEKDLRRIFEYRRRRMLELFRARASAAEEANP